jgi:xylulokinase
MSDVLPLVIGCDVGTQSVKALLADPGGTVLGTATASYDVAYPRPGFAEQNADDWIDALEQVVPAVIRDAGVAADDVGAIGVAAQLDGLVPVDDRGRPLGPAILWNDRRAVAQCERLRERSAPERVFELTGLNLDAAHVAPKAMWLRDCEPDSFRDASWLPSPGSYVVERLTGERVLDRTNASSTMLYDVVADRWSEELLDASGLEPDLFGDVVASTEIVAVLNRDAAERLGLARGTRVVAGCGDDHGGCLGAGLVGPEVVGDVVGTAEPIGATATTAVRDPERLVETHFHASDGMWLVQNPGFVSGGTVRWCSELLGVESPEAFFALAATAPPGADGVTFVPHLGGATTPVWNDAARAGFSGLALNHGPAHVARAVLEGCCFGFRDVVDQLKRLGMRTDEVRVVGGGARSDFGLQLKADISGRELRRVAGDHATAVGAAMLAGVGVGTFASLTDAAELMVGLGEPIRPRAELQPQYEDAYRRYLELCAVTTASGA